jgi:WD40 repeat protein
VTRLRFSPGGKCLACLVEGAVLTIWDVASARQVCSIQPAEGDVAFSPDGQRVAAASGENLAKVWDANMGGVLLTFTGHGAAVQRLTFSADGKRLVTGSADRSVRFWDAASARELFTLRGHNEAVVGALFAAGGRLLATADVNGTVQIWDAAPPHSQSEPR